MKKKFRLGQSSHANDFGETGSRREGRSQSKRRQQQTSPQRAQIESHDSESMLALPDSTEWNHLPKGTVIQRHSQWVDFLGADLQPLRGTLSGKLRGVSLVCGDQIHYDLPVKTSETLAQIQAVVTRRNLLKRGGIDDRNPWQLIAANLDEVWLCASVLQPALKPSLIERAQALTLDAGIPLIVVITKSDELKPSDEIPELEPLRSTTQRMIRCSSTSGEGLDLLQSLLPQKRIALLGHSGVGKSTLLNRMLNQTVSRTGELSKFGTGKQTTTSTRLIPTLDQGFMVDTPGFRNLSVRGISRHWLADIFPEFSSAVLKDPLSFDPEDEEILIQLNLAFPERLKSLQRLWSEMAEKNPNARGQ
ncbi:MAG: ribosome small subunit-dependent GTPase A [Holophagaceae bacterium]